MAGEEERRPQHRRAHAPLVADEPGGGAQLGADPAVGGEHVAEEGGVAVGVLVGEVEVAADERGAQPGVVADPVAAQVGGDQRQRHHQQDDEQPQRGELCPQAGGEVGADHRVPSDVRAGAYAARPGPAREGQVAQQESLSLVMPVYNEAASLPAVLKRLGEAALPLPWELIIVDDGSTDGGVEQIRREWVADAERVVVIRGRRNQGKGAALRRGFAEARGTIVGVQDADTEYDPRDIPRLLEPLLDGRVEAVFGLREFGAHSAYSFRYVLGNRLVSLVASALFDRFIRDSYTCYKFVRREVLEQLELRACRFDIEAELTGELLRRGARVMEVPISYVARTRQEGKKIRPRDGIAAIARLLEVRLRRP